MSYTDVTVICEGALDEERTFMDDVKMREWIDGLQDEIHVRTDEVEVEVFLLDHDHEELGEDEECSCAQYLQDHRPNYIFRSGGDPRVC